MSPSPADPVESSDGGAPAEEELAALADRWRRAASDADRLRKRFERRLAEQSRAERARTVLAFLPVLDDLEQALREAENDPATLATRVRAAQERAADILDGLGFTRLGRIGERFNPDLHEITRTIAPYDGVAPCAVAAVMRPGYTDDQGILLRPARVAVTGTQTQQAPN